MKLTLAQIATLKEMLSYNRQNISYGFRMATCRSLVELGLASISPPTIHFVRKRYFITDLGRESLRALGGGK